MDEEKRLKEVEDIFAAILPFFKEEDYELIRNSIMLGYQSGQMFMQERWIKSLSKK